MTDTKIENQGLEPRWQQYVSGSEALKVDMDAAIEQNRPRYDRIFVDAEDRHVTFAAIGNEVFPATDADGKAFPLHDPIFNEYLRRFHPEKKAIQDHYVGLLRSFTNPAESDAGEYAGKYPQGMPMKEIARIAQLDRRDPEYQYLKAKLNKGVRKNSDFLMEYEDEEMKEAALKEALGDANDLYDEFIKTVYGEDSSFFGFRDEVLFEDDPAELILMAFNAKDGRIRLEAKRKLLLAEEAGRAKMKRGKGDHEMKRYTGMMNESGVYFHESDESQSDGLYTFYLVSYHPEKGNRECVEAYFTQAKPENLGPDYKVKRMAMRCSEMSVPDGKGGFKKEKIYFHQGDRRKSPFRMIQKGMIKDSKNPSQFTEDMNGKRHVYGTLREMELVRRHIKDRFWEKGCGIQEWDWEDSSKGRDASGHTQRPGQSGKLQFVKHTEEITFPPEFDKSGKRIERREQFIYEHQDFDAVMFANYTYQIGVMHSQYEVSRVIRGSVAELITPKAVYGHDIVDIQFRQDKENIERMWSEEDAMIFAERYIREVGLEIAAKEGDARAVDWEVEFRKRHNLVKPSGVENALVPNCSK